MSTAIRRAVCGPLAIFAAILVSLSGAGSAHAAANPFSEDTPLPYVNVTFLRTAIPGFKVTPAQALHLAEQTPTMQSLHRSEHPLNYAVYLWPHSGYEVDFNFHGKPLAGVIVSPTGHVGTIYRGALVVGLYARGHYSSVFDNPLVYLPFGLLFLAPIILLRRATWLDRLDLAVLASFGVSYALFNNLKLEPAVWAFYPPLLYLLGRMLYRGWNLAKAPRDIEVRMPTWLLAGGLLALVAGRVAVALADPHVMDVGYASMVGAYKILHGQSIYFPSLGHPDTYGPVAYLLYVPFQLLWPATSWVGYVPGARAATLTFDLVTIAGLFLLGRQYRPGRAGLRLGLLLAWLWAACPFSVLGLAKNTNDGMIAMMMVLALLALGKPARRGIVLGLATAAKFSPAVLVPLLAGGHGGTSRRREARIMLAAFVIAAGVPVALLLPPGGLKEMWDHTIGYQLTRPDIFSIWALHPSLAPIKDVLELGAIALALLVVLRPRGRRSPVQVSALAGALVIATQLPLLHWFYLYVVWFLPLVLVAVLGGGRQAHEPALEHEAVPALAAAGRTDSEPELAGALS